MPSYFTLTRGDWVNRYKFDPNADPQYALFNITKDLYCFQNSPDHYLDGSTSVHFLIFEGGGKLFIYWQAWERIEIEES